MPVHSEEFSYAAVCAVALDSLHWLQDALQEMFLWMTTITIKGLLLIIMEEVLAIMEAVMVIMEAVMVITESQEIIFRRQIDFEVLQDRLVD